MPFTYEPCPPNDGPLSQGEILGDVWEYRLEHPATEPSESPPPFRPVCHPLMIVLTAACDLEWDHSLRARSGTPDVDASLENEPSHVPYVFLCDLYGEAEVRPRAPGSDIWKRMRQNQDERYHRLEGAFISGTTEQLPELYLDFKKTIALPTATLYVAISKGGVRRIAVVPPVFVHSLVQRYYSFLARVGTPA